MNTDISKLKLESRLCACGCGLEFKVLAHSTQKYFNRRHNTEPKVFDVGAMAKITMDEQSRMINQREKAKASGKRFVKSVIRRKAA